VIPMQLFVTSSVVPSLRTISFSGIEHENIYILSLSEDSESEIGVNFSSSNVSCLEIYLS
jgi:hypothetical protein